MRANSQDHYEAGKTENNSTHWGDYFQLEKKSITLIEIFQKPKD